MTGGNSGELVDCPEPESVVSAVRAIYSAATGHGPWDTAADLIAKLLRSDGAAILLTGAPPSRGGAPGVAGILSGDWPRFGPNRSNADSGTGLPERRAPSLASWTPAEPALAVGLLAVREDPAREFAAAERALFDTIFDHVRRAAVIASRLAHAERDVEARGAAVEALGIGLIVMNGRGETVQQNPAAAHIVRRQRWICRRGKRVHAVDRAREPELQRLLSSMRRPHDAGSPNVIVLQAAGQDALCLTAVPLQSAHGGPERAPDDPAFALVLSCAPAREDMPLSQLGELFGLTQAETRVFASVALGLGVPETAKHLGVAPATVKTHLLNVFRKTDTQGQNDLVRLAARWASPLAEGAGFGSGVEHLTTRDSAADRLGGASPVALADVRRRTADRHRKG